MKEKNYNFLKFSLEFCSKGKNSKYYDNRYICLKIGSDLYFFRDTLDFVWTGLKFNVSKQKYQWCGNSVSSYRNWCTDEPKLDVTGDKLCVAMKVDRVRKSSIARGCFQLFNCKTELPYICHRRCNNYEFMESAVDTLNNLLQL